MSSFADRRLDLDLHRRSSDRVLAGVAGGVADRLGVSAGYARAAFVVMALLWGLGVVLYVALWMATFEQVEDREPHSLKSSQQIGIGLMFLGALVALRSLGLWPNDALVVMVGMVSFGMAVLSDFDWLGRLLDPEAVRPSKPRLLAGAVLLLAGLGIFAGSISQVRTLGQVTTAVVVTMVGVLLVFGPWLVGMGRALTSERRERIRQEERAEMAAHLHDSVLQTLALMQRTDDPKRMVTLARQQERELRSWLYGARPSATEQLFAAALEDAAARVETDFTVPVEVVTVGDGPLDETGRALVAAAGEAMINAAKHSGANEVSVYAELADGRADVWVADLGKGFDPGQVPADRRGLTDSIHARMARVGGGAQVDARPGEGTEVHLWGPYSQNGAES
ncbi:MAG TPA: PspC domain-containing protein [Acidimicrobiia bacterium]|nr:PspC domain-containing protein [Acidimicrobiia bacterium]